MKIKLLILCAVILTAYDCISQFLPAVEISKGKEGSYLSHSALGDLDGDGTVDLATLNGSMLYILKGYSGTFTDEYSFNLAPFNYDDGFGDVSRTYLLDMDGDGDLDPTNEFGWIENDNFNFTTVHYYTSLQLKSNTGNLKFGDINGDGAIDVMLTGIQNPGVYQGSTVIVLNDGTGEFLLSNLSIFPESITNWEGYLGDADGDGDDDLLYSNYPPTNQIVAISDGDGNFTTEYVLTPDLPIGNYPGPMADLNNDGLDDFYYLTSGSLVVRINEGNGVFSPGQFIPIPCSTNMWTFWDYTNYGDYNDDGYIDILYQCNDANVLLIVNDGTGNFTYQEEISICTTGWQSIVLWHDLNRDSKLDCIRCIESVYCSYQDSNGHLIAHDIVDNGIEAMDASVCTLDYDNDGDEDILSSIGNGLGVYENPSNGVYSPVKFLAAYSGLNARGLSDVNNDNIDDIICVTYQENGYLIVYVEGLGNNEFGEVHSIDTLVGSYSDLALIDADLDGVKDFFYLTRSSTIQYLPPFTLSWRTYNTSSGLGIPHQLGTWNNDSNTYSFYSDVISTGDYNGDGHLDLMVAAQGSIRIFHGNGLGDYAMINPTRPIQQYELLHPVHGLPADFTGDGIDDVLYFSVNTNNAFGKFGLFKFNGTGYDYQEIAMSNPPQNFYVAHRNFRHLDFDADGDEDIVYFNNQGIKIMTNNGSGIFQDTFTTLLGLESAFFNSIDFADLDEDGLQDIIVGLANDVNSQSSVRFFVALNNQDSPYQVHCHVFVDDDGDGIMDAGEAGYVNKQIYFGPDWGYGYTDENGNFNLYASQDEITASINANTSLWNASTPWTYTSVLTTGNPVAELYFGLQPNGVQPTIDVSLVMEEQLCNSTAIGAITVTNTGNTLASGYIDFQLDSILGYFEADIAPLVTGLNEYQWDFDSLYYGEVLVINFEFSNPDFNAIGDSTYNMVVANVTDQSNNILFSDTDNLNYVIQCAYDPNYKEEKNGWTEEGFILPDGQLHYVIHFQNTGNAPATNVRLEDQLSNLLDWSTLEPRGSSHPYNVTISPTGKAIFQFNNIQLPDSSADFTGSMGFVSFVINAVENLAPGTVIENTASIYFDVNPAVVTETVANTIFDCVNLNISAPSLICENEIVNIQSDRTEFETYSWYLNDQLVNSGQELILNVAENGVYNLRLECNSPICDLSDEINFEVKASPEFTITPEDQMLCTSLTLEAEGNGNIVWYYASEAIGSGNAITISNTGQYTAELTNECGTTQSDIAIYFMEGPIFNSISEDITTCDFSALLEATSASEITWLLNDEVVGMGTSLAVNQSGSYTAHLDNGCYTNDQTIEVMFFPTPSLTVNVQGALEFCEGESVQINVATDGSALSWNINNEIIQGQTEMTISETSTIHIIADNGVCQNEEEIEVVVHENPVVNFFNLPGNYVYATPGFESYEWIVNGQIQNEITGDSLLVWPGSYEYTVVVTDENGCMGSHSAFIVGVNEDESIQLNIYPNPASNLLYVNIPVELAGQPVQIFDETGKLIASPNVIKGKQIIVDVAGWSKGLYLVKIRDTSKSFIVE